MLSTWARWAARRLDQLGDSRSAQVFLGTCILAAGVALGLSVNAASDNATQQASVVQQVCDRGDRAARELAVDGSCQRAEQVAADPVTGPRGETGAQGVPGPQGQPGTAGVPGTAVTGAPGAAGAPGVDGRAIVGPSGAPGAAGAAGVAGRDGASIVGPQGPAGRDGVDGAPGEPGATGPVGPQGEPGPTCPTGTALAPVIFADGQQGLGCVDQ